MDGKKRFQYATMNKLRAQKRASTQHFIHQLSSTLFSCTKLILIHRLSIKKIFRANRRLMLNHKLPPSLSADSQRTET